MGRKKLLFISSLLVGVLVIIGLGMAYGGSPAPTPQGFDKYLVYMGAGLYDPGVPPPEGDLAMWFHKEIMGRSDDEIAELKAEAEEYFEDQFGPGLPETMAFGLDPRNEYRCYIISGEWVSSQGWVVRDGGFMTMVPDDGNGGTTLYGEWGGAVGKWVPAGSILVYGDYNIKREGPGNPQGEARRPKIEPLIIHYHSASPIIFHPYEPGMKFQCVLVNEDFGMGLANGTSNPITIDGKTQANIRNILTFPGFGPSVEH